VRIPGEFRPGNAPPENIENNPMHSSGMIATPLPGYLLTRPGKSEARWQPHAICNTHHPMLVIVTTDALDCLRAMPNMAATP
jgi:hypothetical protein